MGDGVSAAPALLQPHLEHCLEEGPRAKVKPGLGRGPLGPEGATPVVDYQPVQNGWPSHRLLGKATWQASGASVSEMPGETD